MYPGIGWVVFRDRDYIPQDLYTTTNVLGFVEKSFQMNFSRGASMILAQYYNFLRLGREGYTGVMSNLRETANYLRDGLLATQLFEQINDDKSVPSVVVRLKDESRYHAADLVARLAQHGWIVPAFTLPPNAEHIDVMRMVVKETFSRDMADILIDDMKRALKSLAESQAQPVRPRPGAEGVVPRC